MSQKSVEREREGERERERERGSEREVVGEREDKAKKERKQYTYVESERDRNVGCPECVYICVGTNEFADLR